MKLSLTVEADAVNVLTLNMGRIAVDIDGLVLSELIATVNQNGCPLQIADDPGNTTAGAPPPPLTALPGICCSTAHIMEEDNALLYILSHQTTDFVESEWIHFTGTGYLIRLTAWSYPVLRLKHQGLSKACRRLVVTLLHRYGVGIIHLEVSDFTTFEW